MSPRHAVFITIALVVAWMTWVLPAASVQLGYVTFFCSLFVFGLPHGFVDPIVIWRAGWKVRFGYGFLALLAGGIWWVFPSAAVLGFLGITAWHWGIAEVPRETTEGFWRWQGRGVAQGAVLVLGVLFWDRPGAIAALELTGAAVVLPEGIWLGVSWFACLLWTVCAGRGGQPWWPIIGVIILVMTAPALLAVATYYVGWHSWRSYRVFQKEAPEMRAWSHFWAWLTIAGVLAAAVTRNWQWDQAGLGFGLHFKVLGVLTLPHAVLALWLDRNGGKKHPTS